MEVSALCSDEDQRGSAFYSQRQPRPLLMSHEARMKQGQVEALARFLLLFYSFFFPVIYLMKEESKVDSAEACLMNKTRCGTPLAHSFARAGGVVPQPIFTSSLQC